MTAYTMSSILVGVAEQALSFRRDVLGHDYPTEFYENLLMPPKYLSQSNSMDRDFRHMMEKLRPKYV